MLSHPMPHCNSVMQFPLMLLFLEFLFFFLWRLYSIGETQRIMILCVSGVKMCYLKGMKQYVGTYKGK